MVFRKSIIQMRHTKPAVEPERRRLAGIHQEPRLGAHLATSRPWYTHHGIYVGSGKVVHYSGLSRFWRSGPVEEVTLSDFASGRSVWVVNHAESTYSAHEIIGRARSRVGEHGYRLLTNNCEHFCNWCMSGQSRSAQIGRPLELSSRAIDLATGIVTDLRRMVARRRKLAPRAECIS
jgi:Lecithin retinol acyltransferase